MGSSRIEQAAKVFKVPYLVGVIKHRDQQLKGQLNKGRLTNSR